MDAASGAAAAWWIIALVALFFAVIPLVVYLAHRLLVHIKEINDYANDVLEHGLAITANLEPVPALLDTRDSVKRVGTGLGEYVGAVRRLL